MRDRFCIVRHQVNVVSDDDRPFDPVQTLTDHAEQLNAICSPGWWPKVSYEIMSGALIWSDETSTYMASRVKSAHRESR